MKSSDPVEQPENEIGIEEDIPFQKSGWRLQRIVSFFIFLITILAALGMFGGGVLSSRTTMVNGQKLEYEYFLRHEGHSELLFTIADADSISELKVPLSYFTHVKFDHLEPEAISHKVVQDSIIYSFHVQRSGQIRITTTPVMVGTANSSLLFNGIPFSIHHFIYP